MGRYCELVRAELETLARGEMPRTDYRTLVRRQSDPDWVPPPPPKLTRAEQIRLKETGSPHKKGCGC